MKNVSRLVAIWYCTILPVAAIHADGSHEQISTLKINSGLSNSSVNVVFQDRRGLMWFGTWDGLNRYDGNSIRQYNHCKGDSTSLSYQVIRGIAEEDDSHLWITTDYGINRLDKNTGYFRQYFLDYKPQYIYREKFFSCSASGNGTVAASFYGAGLYLFDKKTETFNKATITGCAGQPGITTLFFDEKNALWIFTDRATFMRVEFSDKGIPTASHEIALPNGTGQVTPLYDRGKYIWFSIDEILFRINIYDKHPEATSTGIKIDGTLQTAYADKNNLLIGTTTGCYELVPHGLKKIDTINASVLSIFKGSQDVMWIGTDGKGVYQQFARQNFITRVEPERYDKSNNNYPVRAILKDSNERLWIGSKGGGLTQISHFGANGIETTKHFNVGTGRTFNSVLALTQGNGRIWIGTDGKGVRYYDYASGKISNLTLPSSWHGKPIESVYCILQSDSTSLYVGTSGGGLFCISLDKDQNATAVTNFTHSDSSATSLGSNIIYDLANDGNGLWIATRGGGLSRLNKISGEVETFKTSANDPETLCGNDLISLHKDSKGRLWIGTTSGISLLENCYGHELRFRNFDKNSGLPNSNIHSILEDGNRNIWISTSHGLARINPDNFHISTYFYEDGLQDNEFADGAGFASPDGATIYFGGINGFNIIHPLRITDNRFMPDFFISSLSVDGKANRIPGNHIKLDYNTGAINFGFSVIDYIDNKKCQLSYKLEPQSILSLKKSEWINLGNSRTVMLNQLPSGKYNLWVKVSNSAQTWGKPQLIVVEISDPVWGTWWAICIYIIITASVGFYIYKIKRRHNNELYLEKQEKIKKEEIHQAKLKFFTNIAHEFSNSITLIYGAVEQILAKISPDSSATNQLHVIQSNAERMRQQIQELMEFRKVETGYLRVQLEKVDIVELIKYTADNFINAVESKRINLDINTGKSLPPWIVDRSMLEKIIFNLLSNALKYTPEGGYVAVSASITADGNLMITCTNNGPGIRQDALENVFNRFTILDNFERELSQGTYSRNGIGLAVCKDLVTLMGGKIVVSSEVDKFTTFTVTLPPHSDNEIDKRDTLAEIAMTIQQGVPKQSIFNKRKPEILVVDDLESIRDMISEILGDSYEISTAANGLDALGKIADSRPDLIICDIIMPEMNGIEFMKRIKADERTKYIPVIMLSSKSDIESRVEALETGANMMINKPFHPVLLKATVDNMLHNHTLMKHFSESASAFKEKYANTMIGKDDKAFIESVIDVLSKNYGQEGYNQDSLARDLAMSRIQLYRKLRKIIDTTPGNFIRAYRMTQVENMLLHTDKTIQEIMLQCGFHNKAYFFRIFQETHNCSPKEYRQNRRSDRQPIQTSEDE